MKMFLTLLKSLFIFVWLLLTMGLFSHQVSAQTCGDTLRVDYYTCGDTNQDFYKADCALMHRGKGTYDCSMQGAQCQTTSTVCDSSNNNSVCYKNVSAQGVESCGTDFSKCGKDLCWFTPTNTPRPGDPTPTSGGGGGNGYWRVSGNTRNSTNGLLEGVTVKVEWPSGSPQEYTSGNSGANLGVYTVTKNENNVPSSGNFLISAYKAGSWQFYATNASPGYGCTRVNNNTKYSCPMSMGFNQPDPPPKVLHFQAIAPTPTPTIRAPECTSISVDNPITKGQTKAVTVGARDLDDGTANGAGIGIVQLFWHTPGQTDWTLVSADEYAQPYTFSLNTNNIPVSGTSRNIELVANVYKTANCQPYNKSCTTGNPFANPSEKTISANCSRTITINNPQNSPTPGACQAPSLSGSTSCSGTVKNIPLSWSAVSGCSQYGIQVKTNSTSFTNTDPISNTTSSTSFTYGTGFQKSSSHSFRVKCTQANACTVSNNWSNVYTSAICPSASATPVPTSPPSCTGTRPTNTSICSGDGNQNGTWTRVTGSTACSTAVCQYYCASGYAWNTATNRCENSCTVTLSPGSLNVATGSTVALNANVSGPVGTPLVEWSDSNSNRVSILNISGTADTAVDVRGDAAGTASVSVTVSGNGFTCTDSAPVTVSSVACSGTRPANTTICSGDGAQSGSWSRVSSSGACSTAVCEYHCSAGYSWNGSACVAPTPTPTIGYYSCTGTKPANTTLCTNDDTGLTANASYIQVADSASCTNSRKCQWHCSTGYAWDGNSCEPNVQTRTCGQSCDGTTQVCAAGLTCRNNVCKNSSCTNAQQNASCVCQGVPTNTPAPVACATPSGLNCGSSCNASGDMVLSCTFTRDTRVTGFTVNYDDDSGFGTDSQNITTSVTGSTALVTYDATTTFPNQTHWYRIKNRVSDGSCVVGDNQYTNTVSTGPATCATYSCIRTRPANSSIHPDDEPPTGSDVRWAHSTTDSNRQCEYFCNAGYTYNATTIACETTSYSCGRTRPANTLYYTDDNEPTTSGVDWLYAASDSPRKCEFKCDTGYEWNATDEVCELPPNACVAPVITAGAITCASGGTLTGSWNSVAGASTYRYQRNTSASTTGAVSDDVSGTSLSTAIEDPTVKNYFRVRVQTVTATAACTRPGSWSAWREVNANASCVAASPTPVPCSAPGGFTISPTCSGVYGNLSATWDKEEAALLGYDYEISEGSNFNSANIVDSGRISQPLGDVVPPGFSYDYPNPYPPNLRFRVRSVCTTNTNSGWSSRNTAFPTPACGGPTSTPVPPPPYDVTVNLRVTDDNACLSSGPNEDPIINDPFTSNLLVDELGDVGPTLTPMPITNGTFTITGLRNTNNLQPRYVQFSNNETPGWTRATCQDPSYATVYDAADSPVNFYLSEIKGPWWQSSFGDVYANVLSSTIPLTANNRNLSISDGNSEAGAVVWNTTLDISTGTPSQKNYAIDREALSVKENFAYFDSKLGGRAEIVIGNDINAINVNGVPAEDSKFYRLTGNQVLSSNWHVVGKVVILIDDPNAQLTIQGVNPISVGSDGFIFFVVNGSINFSAEVDQVSGMFMARNDITISYNNSNQDAFKGYGSFISTNGDIISNRSLAGDDNRADPATEFIYQPSMVINTPGELKTNTTVWTEVAP